MNITWRVAGFALVAGLALLLITLILKLLLAASVLFVLVRVAGKRLAGRAFGNLGREGWSSADIISIDNPLYRSPGGSQSPIRIIPIG